jgi:GGDEF domain-containing protein
MSLETTGRASARRRDPPLVALTLCTAGVLGGDEVRVGASIGVLHSGEPGLHDLLPPTYAGEELLAEADRRMYLTKQAGKARR